MDIFTRIAERRIIEAMENGEFENLEGMGKPFNLEDETWIPEDLRMAYRILKNAGCIPPELELRNEVINMSALINTIDDDKERLKKIRELNFKILRLNIMRRRPFNLDDIPEYEGKVVDKFTGGL
ncbi:MAG TPA: DnaJ family domain-containing protein [Thermodesulfovibrionales bacterium]|nr:DnaJ family domain-containing protein [Thermodesulfovibrionales bacterium]